MNGGGGRAALVLLTVAVAVAIAGCSAEDSASEGAVLTVYASLPLSGPAAMDGRDAADGARLALAESAGEIGDYSIEARFLDAGAGPPGWSPARSAANARAAARDASSIAYLGDFQSGATRASLPITNEARVLQVSPASGAPDLVAPNTASDDVPEDVQTTGERTFGRVIASDDAQARAAAAWAAERGLRRVGLREDGTAFGGVLANAFRAQAAAEGIEVRGRGGITYYAGSPERFGMLNDDVILSGAEGGPVQMGSDAFLTPYVESASAPVPVPSHGGRAPSRDRPVASVVGPTRVTSAALDPRNLPAAGRDFARRFEREYGRAPGRYAAYGYEAMAVILDSIERADDPADRDAVVGAFLDTADRESILGPYSISETGEATLSAITGYELRAGRPTAAERLAMP